VDACDILVQIPIAPHIDSLNVAIASGIFMHKFSRVSVKR
jgi:tRNA G18 (ribose-2'-O)-methylase SpoU